MKKILLVCGILASLFANAQRHALGCAWNIEVLFLHLFSARQKK